MTPTTSSNNIKPDRRTTKGQTFPPEVLSGEEVQALMDACSTTSRTGVRNRTLIALLYRTGLRISEALALRPKDLNREVGSVRVLHGKGNKARTVGLDPAGFAMLDPWLEIRRGLDLPPQAPVICTLTGNPVRSGSFRVALSKLAKLAGIEKRVHPHGLRHTLAAELRAEGVDIGVISKQLGHASIATTARYLDHIAPTMVIEAMREREWRGG